MNPGFNRKLGIFAALSGLACTAAVGALAHWSAQQAIKNGLRAQAQTAASQIAMRASDELKSISERARFYVANGLSKSFESYGELLALSVLHKPEAVSSESADWAPTQRWVLPETAPARLAAADFGEIDLKHPVDYDRISKGQSEIIFGKAKNTQPFLRLAVPFGEKTAEGYTQAIVAEIKMSIEERGGAKQHTDVVSINADVLEVAEEANRYVVSVRFTGTIREDNANSDPVDEIWHLTKPRDGASGWQLAGIQQAQ